MKAPENTSKPRVLCPRGIHLCRCVQVADLGTQHFKPGDDGSRKLYLAFETCNARHTFKDEKGPEPFMLQIEFAWYMKSSGAKKTKLRQFVEGWFEKAFPSEQEAQDFDFSKLLGKAAMISVAHLPKQDGNHKAVIADCYLPRKADGDTLLPKNEVPPAVNTLVCYEVYNGEDENFRKLPEFLQKKIRESDEFKKRGQTPAEPEHSEYDATTPDESDSGLDPDSTPF